MTRFKPFKKPLFFALILLLAAAAVLICGFRNKDKAFESTTTAMGTYVTQILCGPDANSAYVDANNEIKTLENQISWRIDGSDVQRINSSSESVEISKNTADILALSLDVAKNSGGAFNPTILPISSLWDFGGRNNVPSREEIEKQLPLIDFLNLSVDPGKLCATLKGAAAVDLGAVGKGAACDAAINAYKKSRLSYGVISVGGSIGLFGSKPDGSPFKIAIRNPLDTASSVNSFAVLSMTSGCVSTSGSYERSFCADGNFYHHIINPNTGYPTENDLLCVTVTHESGVLTDLLSTACFVLGRENSRPLLEHYGAFAVFVDKNKNVFVSEGLKKSIKITDSEFCLCNW